MSEFHCHSSILNISNSIVFMSRNRTKMLSAINSKYQRWELSCANVIASHTFLRCILISYHLAHPNCYVPSGLCLRILYAFMPFFIKVKYLS